MLNAPKDNESCTCRQRKIMKSEESKDRGDIMRLINIFDSVLFKRILVCIYVSIDIYSDQRLK